MYAVHSPVTRGRQIRYKFKDFVSNHVFSPPRQKTHSPGFPLVVEAVFLMGG